MLRVSREGQESKGGSAAAVGVSSVKRGWFHLHPVNRGADRMEELLQLLGFNPVVVVKDFDARVHGLHGKRMSCDALRVFGGTVLVANVKKGP